MKKHNISTEYPTWEINSFRDLLDGITARYPDNTAFAWRDADAENGIASRTYAEAAEDIKNLATYLCAMGLEGRHIAVCGKNSYLWEISYLAVMCGCGVAVPLDKELCTDELAGLLAEGDCAAILYGEDMTEALSAIDLPDLLKLPMAAMSDYLANGAALRAVGSRVFENHTIDPDAPGVILYTSGTVGIAKGVMLSQRSLCRNTLAVCKTVLIREDDCVLTHLPLHHIYECASHMAFLYSGACIAFNDNLRQMPADLTLFRPTVLVTVPAVLDFIAHFVRRGYKEARGGKLLLGVQRAATGMVSAPLSLLSKSGAAKTRRSIYSTVHTFMGGKLRAILVGAAPLSSEIFLQLEKFGYAVYAGYGLTEASPTVLMHSDRYRSAQDVGHPLPGVEVCIDAPDSTGEGELCVRGEGVMLGYYKNEEETAHALRGGWLHTGDLAVKTPSGAYRITGRIKSMIVMPTGRKVYPEEQEAMIKAHPLVSDCMVYAAEEDGTPTLCAAVYPDITLLTAQLQLPENTDLATLSEEQTARAKELLLDIIRTSNAKLPTYKHIKRLVIRKTPFDKTALGKLRRTSAEINGISSK
ncbi:MAG: AMP-binding protein [Clostridia bacterium]|nr:AMP-binding protein [Clostridia bacterium]